MSSETCLFCIAFKYSFAAAVGFGAGVAWMMFG
jgi:hypothetical protein